MKKSLSLILVLCFALPQEANPQAWSGIIATTRAIDWTLAGVVGGIPSAAWTQCVNANCAIVTSAGLAATATQINTAMASAPANTYVLLGASGTYNISTGLLLQPNVELRGLDPNRTYLNFTGINSCGNNGDGAAMCFGDLTHNFYGSTAVARGGVNSFDWTAGYAQGTTSITLQNVGATGISNGYYVTLDEDNDSPATPSTSNTSGLLICDRVSATDGCSLEGGAPGRCSTPGVHGGGGPSGACNSGGGVDRNFQQIVKVVSGCSPCSGAGPFTVTISPGIYSPKWNAGANPGGWIVGQTMQNSGISNLTVDFTNVSGCPASCAGVYAVQFTNAFNCWSHNVRTIKAKRAHYSLWNSAHITVDEPYMYGTQAVGTSVYGVELFGATDWLVQSAIHQQITAPIVYGPSVGGVYFNFFTNNNPFSPSTWLQQSLSMRHDAGVVLNLAEEGISTGVWEDAFHGSGGMNTNFRNYMSGFQPGITQQELSFQAYAYNRFENAIGNVMGCNQASAANYPGCTGTPQQTTYQTTTGVGASPSIWSLGPGNSESNSDCGTTCVVLADPYVATSLFRWGNYDVQTGTTRFQSSEVPSGLTDGFANAVPGSTALPASFYYASKPAYWGLLPWPAIGPDVTAAAPAIAGVSAHVGQNPAMNCAFNVMGMPQDGSGAVLTYNGDSCYSNAGAGVGSTAGAGASFGPGTRIQ